jgi:hypothetical protein
MSVVLFFVVDNFTDKIELGDHIYARGFTGGK